MRTSCSARSRARRNGTCSEALQPVRRFVEILAKEPIVRARSLDARLEALPLMVHAFDDDAPVAAAYVGYDDGSFFLLRPLRDASERSAFAAPGGRCFPGPVG